MTSLPPSAGAPLRRRGGLLHLAGMDVSSPLSGWLRDRLGRLPMIGVGGIVLLNALGAALLVVPNPWAS